MIWMMMMIMAYVISVLWNVFGECDNFASLSGHKGAVLDLAWSADSACVLHAFHKCHPSRIFIACPITFLAQLLLYRQLFSVSTDKFGSVWDALVCAGVHVMRIAFNVAVGGRACASSARPC